MYKILIVDDMLVNRKLMKKVLADTVSGVQFVDAEDGFQALEILEKQEIDLVILDLMMPGKDGYEVLKDMKADHYLADIPVIVNSAITDMESIKKTLELGAMDYFTKPITPEQMKVIIPMKATNALKFYEQRKQLKQMNNRMKNELKIASVLQRSLIHSQDEYQDFKLYQKYMACEELGGDLFDFVETDNTSWFMIADITGHGVAAALVASMLKVVFNNAIRTHKEPASVLKDINLTFYRLMSDSASVCFSVFVGMIEDNTITYSNAGHPYPILLKKNFGEWQMLEINGYLIGLFDDAEYENKRCEWSKGEAIFTYTDGLFETPGNPEHSKSFDDVMQHAGLLEDRALADPESFMEQILVSFGKEDENQIDDDIALMYIMRKE